MSVQGQKRNCERASLTSGLPQGTDIVSSAGQVRKVPILLQKSQMRGDTARLRTEKWRWACNVCCWICKPWRCRIGGTCAQARGEPSLSRPPSSGSKSTECANYFRYAES